MYVYEIGALVLLLVGLNVAYRIQHRRAYREAAKHHCANCVRDSLQPGEYRCYGTPSDCPCHARR